MRNWEFKGLRTRDLGAPVASLEACGAWTRNEEKCKRALRLVAPSLGRTVHRRNSRSFSSLFGIASLGWLQRLIRLALGEFVTFLKYVRVLYVIDYDVNYLLFIPLPM